MTTWRPGMKATLADKSGCWINIDLNSEAFGPAFGDVLIVSEVYTDDLATWLWFAEWGNEVHFDAQYFRPVVTQKSDISIFTAMLNPSRQPVRETA